MTEPMNGVTYADVMASVEAAKRGLQTAATHVLWQIENRVWLVTGHTGWDEFRTAYYDGIAVILPTDDRKELVPKLVEAGMSQQQIADTLGVGQKTVSRDVSHMTNVPEARTDSLGRQQPTRKTRRLGVVAEATDEPEPKQEEEPRGNEQEEQNKKTWSSVCSPDPSDGANSLKGHLRGFKKQTLDSWYQNPTHQSLDVLDAWLNYQKKLSERARKQITP